MTVILNVAKNLGCCADLFNKTPVEFMPSQVVQPFILYNVKLPTPDYLNPIVLVQNGTWIDFQDRQEQ